ncbi:MAG: hypothetical protein KA340_08130 [Saprospiraceae bacterium]|nr:hypothetical protein [Saprospiraceae bacterium]
MLKKILSNNAVLIIITIGILLCGFICSISKHEPEIFQRFGSLVIGMGFLFFSRTVFRNEHFLTYIGDSETSENLNSIEYYKKRGLEVPQYVENDNLNRKTVNIYAPIVSIIGTFISGYGDFIIIYLL